MFSQEHKFLRLHFRFKLRRNLIELFIFADGLTI